MLRRVLEIFRTLTAATPQLEGPWRTRSETSVSTSDFSMVRQIQESESGCLTDSIFSVKNHGIPDNTVNSALAASKEFFSLPDEKKTELDITKSPGFKGYNSLLSSNNDPTSMGDMHEGFEFGWEELVSKDHDQKRANDGVMAGANVWPEDLPSFREAALTY